MAKHKTIKFNLLSNAKDSIRQAVQLLALNEIGSKQAQLKHAITSSAHAIELLLKEKLRQIDPSLVWEDPAKYPSLNARTVTVDGAIKRLKSNGVSFSSTDEVSLRDIRNTRNAIEHFEWETTEQEAKIVVGNALSFALAFALNELKLDLASDFKHDDTWGMFLSELYAFSRLHGARIEARFRAKGEWPECCAECGELTVPMRGGSCELCGHWQLIDESA